MGPGTPPGVAREIEAGMSRVASQMKTRMSLRIGKPTILWSAVLRLPDEAVTADEGGGGESVSFLLRPKDRADWVRLTSVCRGATVERSASYDATDAQLRRWRASAGGRRIGDDGNRLIVAAAPQRGGSFLGFVDLASRERMRPQGSWRTIRIEEAGRCGQGSLCRVCSCSPPSASASPGVPMRRPAPMTAGAPPRCPCPRPPAPRPRLVSLRRRGNRDGIGCSDWRRPSSIPASRGSRGSSMRRGISMRSSMPPTISSASTPRRLGT